MDTSKFTKKSLQAIEACQSCALEYGNQELVQEHLLYGLLMIEDSLIAKLVERMEINKDHFVQRIITEIEKRTKVSGADPYLGQDLRRVLSDCDKEAKQMGDEYVSVEHIFLAILENPSSGVKEIMREYGINRERFLKALSTVRGNQRVTSDNPENTYETLTKFGTELVERARKNKLDPVIGREEEIRNVIRILSRKQKIGRASCRERV